MAVYVALLRAVNVGGTGKLAMGDLRRLCEGVGFEDVTTCIQSGNVVFSSGLAASEARKKLAAALEGEMGRPVSVLLRTPSELEAIVRRNPFPEAAPRQLLVLFLDRAPRGDVLADLEIPGREEIELSGREVFVHYPDGMGRSRLKLPFAAAATGRNLNTVRKLLELSRAVSGRDLSGEAGGSWRGP